MTRMRLLLYLGTIGVLGAGAALVAEPSRRLLGLSPSGSGRPPESPPAVGNRDAARLKVFGLGDPGVGQPLPDLVVRDLNGAEFPVKSLLTGRPAVLEFGSGTCENCRTESAGMEELARRLEGKVDFLFIYTREAHPRDTASGPTTPGEPAAAEGWATGERLRAARAFAEPGNGPRRVLVDGFGLQSAHRRYGSLYPNPVSVVDANGIIALQMPWANAGPLGRFLERLLAANGTMRPDLEDLALEIANGSRPVGVPAPPGR